MIIHYRPIGIRFSKVNILHLFIKVDFPHSSTGQLRTRYPESTFMSVSECTFVAQDIVLSEVNIRYKIATFNAHPRSCIYIIGRGNSSHHACLDVHVYSLMKEQIRHS